MSTLDLESLLQNVTTSTRYICPVCGPNRKKKNEKTLSVTFEDGDVIYYCHHCQISGRKTKAPFYEEHLSKPESKVRAISVPKQIDQTDISAFLNRRGIDYSAVKDKYRVVTGSRYFRGHGDLLDGDVQAIGFVYGNDEAVKWRAVEDKRFTQDGAARTLWGIDNARRASEIDAIVITEGEIDCLTVAPALPENFYAMSVPNGAPQRVSNRVVDATEDTKFSYIWDAKDVLSDCDKIVLVTDNDEAGEALREELARRIGRAKCYSVIYPDDCKDANDVLNNYGMDAVRGLIDSAEALPLEGVYQVSDYRQEVQQLYQNGMIGGLSTGIHSIDNLFTIVQGQLSIVTGLPGSGKSEFIDQLMVNLSQQYGWKFAVASFENPPALHIAKLAEKISGKPFFDGPTAKMSETEASTTLDYIHEHFMFLEQRTGEAATIDSVLDRCQQAVMRMGVRGLVIDPYNYIAQSQKADNEHQGINDMLTRLVAFARAQGIHIWFIAHPAKMPTDQEGRTAVPKGMNISGSASFFAKADLGVTVHRNKNGDVEVHCWKVRFKWLGKLGKVTLDYDVPSGRYSDQSIDIDIDISTDLARSYHETEKEWY